MAFEAKDLAHCSSVAWSSGEGKTSPAAHAEELWTALLTAGESLGVRTYGLDALNTLRIEKGHLTSAELNGNTSAADLGMQRLLKKQGDFIGRTLAQRPALGAPERAIAEGARVRETHAQRDAPLGRELERVR